jgi:CRISPR-associated endonuclease/helicase Cas3
VWESVYVRSVAPGATLLLPTSVGGYGQEFGWTGEARDIPQPVEIPTDASASDYDEGDPWTHRSHDYVTLATHSSDVVAALEQFTIDLDLPDLPCDQLRHACRWHDVGKAHEVFQELMVARLEPQDPRRGGVWAKSDGVHAGNRYARPHFRHELASALAFLQQGGSDLEVYLVAAHHGKIRLSIRSRPTEPAPNGDSARLYALGVYDGDVLPQADLGDGVISTATSLALSPMELGSRDGQPSWVARCLALLDEHGPFRLAYLEALVRIADWRGTRTRAEQEHRDA